MYLLIYMMSQYGIYIIYVFVKELVQVVFGLDACFGAGGKALSSRRYTRII
jgi:hypothetical protein